ncbi:MAG: rod shape-determining protein MreD [Xanthomonadales bacterium]|nr:rod shape-determining protein MreD [Xanthomonadales bacterium]MCC6595371.1 rod shape-determining protein MreD [Rhodanobacteraceae bacterium]MDL1870110.1 rod shape-determining protein MreD [Gammaproteobacteria bacterium PRO6]
MSRLRLQAWLVGATVLVAFALQLMPLPPLAEPFKPYWLGLVVVYWAIEAPERMGLGRAFVLGLCGDLLIGELLGEQAMRLLVLAFIVLRFRARLRAFPLAQQALALLVLLLNDRVVTLMIRGFAGEAMPPATFWIAPVSGALAWPLLYLALDRARLYQRSAD